MKISKHFKKICGIVLNIIIPLKYSEQRLNKMTAEKFLSLTEPAEIPPAKNTIAIVNYRNKFVKEAVWALKFKNNYRVATLFAEIIYDTLIEELADLKLSANFNNPILIAIPMTKRKIKKRGYNQAELIAQKIAQIDGENFFEYRKHILKKIKNTAQQSRVPNKKERLENLKGCFKVINPSAIKNRNIILLDDVTTTGATLTEASQTLRLAGARQILCVAFAH
ncbi:MAG: hypothetical protein ABIG87_00940 [Patescibacteria group bacterium]